MPDHQSPAGNQDRIHERQSGSDSRPVEYYIDEKWDKCIDLTLRRVTYSTLAAGAVALVVLSELFPQICFSPSQGALLNFPELLQLFTAGGGGVRAATTAFGAGFGAGSAYGNCQREVCNSLMCLKASTSALVQPYTFAIMSTAFVVSQIDFSTVVQFQGEVPSVVHHVRPQ